MLRSLLFAAAVLAATPAVAAPWSHPAAGFTVDVPRGWQENPGSRQVGSAYFTRGAYDGAVIGCTVSAHPLQGPPATPTGWKMPDAVMADPAKFLAGSGDRLGTVLGKRTFTGVDRFPGWLLWADVFKAGADKPTLKLLGHVLSAPNTQLTTVCISTADKRGALPPAAIDEALGLATSMRAAR